MYNPQLETFIRVADAGSFNKAAEQAYVTPTAVLKQINLLEGAALARATSGMIFSREQVSCSLNRFRWVLLSRKHRPEVR